MDTQDRIDDLEQQMYVACSDGDYHSMNLIEQQIEQLKANLGTSLLDDPYATESKWDTESY
ncbi:hypothetical protein [Vibrio ulleungensis]|uniref:Uncharacterized protein n=1 Tax=Vibrio ulleungensis TaxID=2807619 RepID=A0ABS2HH05_9VIBR|nr:hypothetical protein [Vibrio ulleungensis]MBM7035752.1 hypothetical protein [Vibrio ulleungensis]